MMPQELTTKKLRKMSKTELTAIANQLATKLQWWHSTGKNEEQPERYQQIAGELFHVASLIEEKEQDKELRKITPPKK